MAAEPEKASHYRVTQMGIRSGLWFPTYSARKYNQKAAYKQSMANVHEVAPSAGGREDIIEC
jgi:hypothetical protein